VAAITGSSRGIGLAVARAFTAEGAKVVVNSRDGAAASAAARDVGGDSVGLGADVTTEAGAAALIDGALSAFGKLDVFVNNAGVVHAGPTLEMSLAEWDRVIKLNMTAVFLCSRDAARVMSRAGGGVIINTASVQAFAPFPRRLAYGTSKAAVVMMTRIMAAEWAPAIRVNAVAPGYVRTEMTARLQAEGRIDFAAIAGRTPQGRMAEPHEIAGAYVYLASPEAAFVTGETVVVDGGWLAFGAFPGI
jgi:NAD(P)-dependent dehydrogenase (short-subunit alcohol dehydrogenase family)